MGLRADEQEPPRSWRDGADERRAAIAQGAQLTAQRLLGDRDPERLPEPLNQVHQPPAHHPMHRRNGARFDHVDQSLTMRLAQNGGLAQGLAVDQPRGPTRIELDHPVAHDLERHAPIRAASVREAPS